MQVQTHIKQICNYKTRVLFVKGELYIKIDYELLKSGREI